MSTIPCFLCGKALGIRTDKNGKRYVVCEPCGIQCFVRRAAGIRLLEKLASELAKRRTVFEAGGQALYQVQATLRELDGVQDEIKKLEPRTGWLFGDDAAIRAKEALEKRARALSKRLQELP